MGLAIDGGPESGGGIAEEVGGNGQAVSDEATVPQIYEEPEMGISTANFLVERVINGGYALPGRIDSFVIGHSSGRILIPAKMAQLANN